ncbi:MAG: HEAT repeat domain-containing protein [Chitinispirillaceae bacterium]|nr:HEAT repeat domain-containing protein [Chitinispirillaceae bacterium]
MKSPQGLRLRHRLFFLLMLCFAAAILGDSTAEALLLGRFGPALIPRMFCVNAAALFILSGAMLTVIDRLDRRIFFFYMLLAHGVILLLLRLAIAAGAYFLFPPLFSYAYSSKILFFLLFWTIANDLIDSRSAGKEFPAIAAGGTIGAIGVSFSIPGLMRFIAVENLLVVWALLAVATGALLLPLERRYRELGPAQKKSSGDPRPLMKKILPLSLLRDEPLLRMMAAFYLLVFFLLLNQHMIFYREVKKACASAGEIASFLGGFNGFSMLSTCLLQVGISGALMRRLGSTRSMMLLPAALLCVFLTMTLTGGLPGEGLRLFFWAVIIGMGIRTAFFDAFFSPNFQLFFSGLPREVRGRGKLLIEGVVKPVAMIGAGCWMLWCVPRLEFRTHLGLMVVAAAAGLVTAVRLKNAYAKTLLRYLTGSTESKKSALLEQLDFAGGENILKFLADKLNHEDFEVQKLLIEIIASAGTGEAAALLTDRLDRSGEKLTATIVAALGNFPEPQVAERLTACLDHPDHRVVANAVEALARCTTDGLDKRLKPLLAHPGGRVRANAIRALWGACGSGAHDRYCEMLRSMIHGGTPEECAAALHAAGGIADENVSKLLFDFCRTNTTVLFRSEIVHRQAVTALGKKRSPRAMEMLLQLAPASSPRQRASIVTVLGTLLPSIDETCWRESVVKGDALSKNCLLQGLRRAKAAVSTESAAALTRTAMREIEAIEGEKRPLQVLLSGGWGRTALLACAVREELIDIRLDTLLHCIALLDPSGVVGSVIQRINHTDAHVRARALEVLENTGDEKINRAVIACIEWLDTLPPMPEENNTPARNKATNVAETYRDSRNEWVAACAEYAGASSTAAV